MNFMIALTVQFAVSLHHPLIQEPPMIEANQLRELIVEVLDTCPDQRLNTPAAVELLMLTAATESHLGTYIRQIKGPARGIFQMEPATEKDIYENYLRFPRQLQLLLWVEEFKGTRGIDLKANLAYQIAMARVHYWRSPMKMPLEDDAVGLANKWKQVYNTELGRGTIGKALADYRRLVIVTSN